MKLKEKTKSFIAGFLVCAVLLTGIFAFAAPGIMREVFYGINVVVNGRVVDFDADSRPFITEGRTFLPVRAISEALGYPVNWDGDTQTVFIGITPGETNLMRDIPRTNVRNMVTGANTRAILNGHEYFDAIRFSSGVGPVDAEQTHALNGQFIELTGLLGIIDGESITDNVTFIFIADGNRRLAEFEVVPASLPSSISVDVTGVQELTIEIHGANANRRSVALVNTTLN
ncbi:MAG: stalk domain-containing protein [Oscillospiraceae bacterium]|nr:stalk domain-containing protein [Oscillospiraceae bacterium]